MPLKATKTQWLSVFQQYIKTLPPEKGFWTRLECHAPLDPVSLSGKMEGEAAEKQLCVIIMTEPKETPSEPRDQLDPLCTVHAKRSFLCDGLFASFTQHIAYMDECSTGTPDTLQVGK